MQIRLATQVLRALVIGGLATFVTWCSWTGTPPKVAGTSLPKKTEQLAPLPPLLTTTSDVLLFVAQGGNGKAQIYDADFGGWVDVFLLGEYNSASGKLCRRFTVASPGRANSYMHYACGQANGEWALVGIPNG